MKRKNRIASLAILFMLTIFFISNSSKNTAQGHAHTSESHEIKGGKIMKPQIPQPLKVEHEELHAELIKATKAGGETGKAAKEVARILHPHFEKEEEFALPPLGLLSSLTEGKVTSEMEDILAMTDTLKAEFHQMLQEHKTIVAALKNLIDAAKEEKKTEYAQFAEKLILHAKTEEEVLYPTTLLIGEYLKLKLKK